ncbi:MAG: hypothetical protein AAF907_16335 [Planctomycetota bacterium]
MVYVAVEFAFVGFLLARYQPRRHPTIASWLAMTRWLALPFAPLYLPALYFGSLRLRNALADSDPMA